MYHFLKRLSDLVFSCVAIVVFLPVWAVICIVIKIKSPGPVIYKAKRVGLNGEIFSLYKFRTMHVNSGKVHATTLRSDPRVYPFGKILRMSKLDETPQFFNILRGEMSIIGPRPEDEINAKDIYCGEYSRILSVKPGLSSPASLYDFTHGEKYDSEESYKEHFLPQKLFLELFYVDNRNYIYDVKIVCRTVVTVVLMLLGKQDFKEPAELKNMKEGAMQ